MLVLEHADTPDELKVRGFYVRGRFRLFKQVRGRGARERFAEFQVE